MRARAGLIAAPAVLAVVAGCSSSPPPSARALIVQIPGCAHTSVNTPSPGAKQDYSCILPGANSVNVVTFSSVRRQRAWLRLEEEQRNPGCCAEGPDWLAVVSSSGPPSPPPGPILKSIARRLGGKVVSSA
jgi:hypothetical protein